MKHSVSHLLSMLAAGLLSIAGCTPATTPGSPTDGTDAGQPPAIEPEESPTQFAQRTLAANKPFAFEFALPDLEGQTIRKADFAGRVLVVDLWGTWCGPCRVEIPSFVQLQDEYPEQLAIVGISYEREPPAKARVTLQQFIADNKMNYACVLGDDATQNQVPDLVGYPTTLFLDRQGAVRAVLSGAHPYAELHALVQQLLNEQTTPTNAD